MPRYIDAEGLNLYDDLFMSEDTINKSGVYVRYKAVENLIKNAPTADVAEVKHGEWGRQVLVDDGFGGKRVGYICPVCNEFVPHKGNYCLNCGAKMDLK